MLVYLCLYVYRLLLCSHVPKQKICPHTFHQPHSWLPWQVDYSLKPKMTQNSLCLVVSPLLCAPSLPLVASDGNILSSFLFPADFQGGHGIVGVITSLTFSPRCSTTNGTSESGNKVCGCSEEGVTGCVKYVLVRIYEQLA